MEEMPEKLDGSESARIQDLRQLREGVWIQKGISYMKIRFVVIIIGNGKRVLKLVLLRLQRHQTSYDYHRVILSLRGDSGV